MSNQEVLDALKDAIVVLEDNENIIRWRDAFNDWATTTTAADPENLDRAQELANVIMKIDDEIAYVEAWANKLDLDDREIERAGMSVGMAESLLKENSPSNITAQFERNRA